MLNKRLCRLGAAVLAATAVGSAQHINAAGAPRYPRLAGQRPTYVVQQLTNFKQGARTTTMHKDVSLYVADARRTQAPLRVAAATDRIWEDFCHDQPDVDFSNIYRYIQALPPDEPRS